MGGCHQCWQQSRPLVWGVRMDCVAKLPVIFSVGVIDWTSCYSAYSTNSRPKPSTFSKISIV